MDGSPTDMGAVSAGGTAAANPRAAQVRIRSASATRVGGQRAHDLRIGPQPDYVDHDRFHLNRVLIEPRTGTALRRESECRRALRNTRRAMKSNAGIAVTGIVTFGHEAQAIFEHLSLDAQDAAYRELTEAVAARLDTDLTGLVVHADESAPHAHFQLTGYDRQGRPISDQAKRGVLRDLQDITAEVMGRHAPGIERGHSKVGRLKAGAKPAEVVNLSVAELHDRLPADLAIARARTTEEVARLNAQAQAAREKLAKNESLAERAALKAQGEGTRAEKAARNAETYERRAQVAREALYDLEGRLDILQHDLSAQRVALTARETALDRKEAKLNDRAVELDRQEARQEREAEWTAHAMGNLTVALDRAISGRHDVEITPEDMANEPEQFAILRDAAPDKRPTWGFRAAFWTHNRSNDGKPGPLPQTIRTASETAFAKIAAFSRERAALFEKTVEAAKRAAEARLDALRTQEAEIKREVSAARSVAQKGRRDVIARSQDLARREARLDDLAAGRLPERDRPFEHAFADLTRAIRETTQGMGLFTRIRDRYAALSDERAARIQNRGPSRTSDPGSSPSGP